MLADGTSAFQNYLQGSFIGVFCDKIVYSAGAIQDLKDF
jgi:hypothetical protein